MKNKRLFRRAPLLAMVLLVSLLSLPLVHAVTFVNTQKLVSASCTCSLPALTVTAGNGVIVVVDNERSSGSPSPTISDSLSSSWNTAYNTVSNGNVRETVFWALMPASGSDTISINYVGGPFSPIEVVALQYTGFTGVGATIVNPTAPGSGTGSDTQTLSIQANSMIIETGSILNSIVNACGSISLADTNRYNNCDTSLGTIGYGQQINEHGPFALSGSISETMQYSGWNTPGGFVHGLIEVQGTIAPGTTVTTKCFGNCGNPAITLANTNSTHGINFNQSLTLFYPFTSSLNGFFVNASVNVAKTYTNGQVISIGVYVVYSCPLGASPFTAVCPGSLITSNAFTNPSKGRLTLTIPGSTTGVSNGQNVAVAVSCIFAPCDINDTNTVVPISQASGNMPPIISQSSTFSSCTCKAGLWTFITGNVVTGVPTNNPTNAACGGLLDCLLPNWVNSLCSNPTSTCTNISGMIWAGGLAMFFTFFTLKGWGELSFAGSAKLPIVDVFLFWGIVWMLAMGGLSLTFAWVPLFFFFVIALMFGKHGTFL